MHFRVWVGIAVAVVWCGAAGNARAEVRTTPINFSSGSGGTGYDAAWFSARYALHGCNGSLKITTEFVPGSFVWSDTYWLNGTSYVAPDGLRPTVRDQGTFNGTVRVRGGGVVGTFRSTAGQQTHGCVGDTELIADLGAYVDKTDKRAVEVFIASLEVIPDRNPVYRNQDIERAIQRKLDEDAREVKRKQEEEKRKADEAARQAELDERKRKDDEDRKRKDDEERARLEAEDVARKSADAEAKRNDADERKRTDEDAARAAQEKADAEVEAIKRKTEADIEKIKADSEAAQQEAARERADRDAKKAAENEARASKTEWTDADARDTSGGYWPNSRCSWTDDRGFIHPPRGKHRCDPEYMREVYEVMRIQMAQEAAEIEAERKAQATRQAIKTMGGGTREGEAVVGAAAAMAPLVDKMGEGAGKINALAPRFVDLEAMRRILFTGGTGLGLSVRAPGIFYGHFGFAAFDSEKQSRLFALNWGGGVQLPLTRAFTLRMIEIGLTIAYQQHVVDRSTSVIGVGVRTGAVYRFAHGLACSASFGIETAGGFGAYTDIGVLWRFDLPGKGRYMSR